MKILNNTIVRIISCFLINKTKRKKLRQRYLVDKRAKLTPIHLVGKNNKVRIGQKALCI